MELKAHDLIRIPSFKVLQTEIPLPEWVEETVMQNSWVVVRRHPYLNGLIPVGIRGNDRNQRFSAYLPFSCVMEVVTPRQLAIQARWLDFPVITDISAFSQLVELSAFYNQAGIIWGPTGSIGFELASGLKTAHSGSDLDVIIYAPKPLDREMLIEINNFNHTRSIRVDALLETPAGACSLAEYVRQESRVLLRTLNGPLLVNCPWS